MEAPVRLTEFSPGAGCGCKLSAYELDAVLGSMTVSVPTTPGVLVGIGGSDDAGVFLIGDDTALVQTLDFFTPIVDDAHLWGEIAATNALSDVYAMGGRPVTALNIVAWPRDVLPFGVLGRVLDGAADVLERADCALVGGHSIDDAAPKFGLAVTGLVNPALMLTNAAGVAGDVLVLTKPLGVGVVTTALKRGCCTEVAHGEAIAAMTRLNALAARVAVELGARCATDVTGFGLMGHLVEMTSASGVGAVIDAAALPLVSDVTGLIDEGHVSGGTARNVEASTTRVDWGSTGSSLRIAACDAQTSGGLLVAIPPDRADTLVARLTESGEPAWRVGELVATGPNELPIRVR